MAREGVTLREHLIHEAYERDLERLRARCERLRRAVLAADRYEQGDVDIRHPADELRSDIALCRKHGDLDAPEDDA